MKILQIHNTHLYIHYLLFFGLPYLIIFMNVNKLSKA